MSGGEPRGTVGGRRPYVVWYAVRVHGVVEDLESYTMWQMYKDMRLPIPPAVGIHIEVPFFSTTGVLVEEPAFAKVTQLRVREVEDPWDVEAVLLQAETGLYWSVWGGERLKKLVSGLEAAGWRRDESDEEDEAGTGSASNDAAGDAGGGAADAGAVGEDAPPDAC